MARFRSDTQNFHPQVSSNKEVSSTPIKPDQDYIDYYIDA